MLIGITGYARVGKDTVANRLVTKYDFTRIGFADKLKQLARLIDPEVDELLNIVTWEEVKQVTKYRKLLQDLGNSARIVLGDTVWIDAVMTNIDKHQHVVIPDVRYPNELEAIKDYGGYVVRVKRPGVGPFNQHITETAQAAFEVDYTLNNDMSINNLNFNVDEMVIELRNI